jgi:hypothetical protein
MAELGFQMPEVPSVSNARNTFSKCS